MFKNRYGVDRLSFVLIFTAIALSVISMFFSFSLYIVSYILHALTIALMAVAFFRVFSRNFQARQRELHKYTELEYKVVSFFKRFIRTSDDRRRFKYFRCPKCHQKLRVPRGKGKLRVRCAKCSHQFEIRA